ncbi:MAG: anacyclamide synthesis protein AcyF, partial [Microcystis aeruginosa W13-11]|nr:anacyclamide synthesis protein AcyF [Microcystis aeruginosa W13-11]
ASCKIELDKLIASRFMLFFKDQSQEWQKCLTQSLAFFQQVENRVGVQLDYSLLQKILGHNFDFSKLTVLSMWVGTTQKELEKTRIENIRLYYYKSFKME